MTKNMKKIDIVAIKSQVKCGNIRFYVQNNGIFAEDTESKEVVRVGEHSSTDDYLAAKKILEAYAQYDTEEKDIRRAIDFLNTLPR